MAGGDDRAVAQHHVAGFQDLAAVDGRIDAQVGEQIIGGRNAGQHFRPVAFLAGNVQRTAGRGDKEAGMAIENSRNALALAHRAQDDFRHLHIGDQATLVLTIMQGKIIGGGIQVTDKTGGDTVRNGEENRVGVANMANGFLGEMRNGTDTRANHGQATVGLAGDERLGDIDGIGHRPCSPLGAKIKR